jgi:hypothetical protein
MATAIEPASTPDAPTAQDVLRAEEGRKASALFEDTITVDGNKTLSVVGKELVLKGTVLARYPSQRDN